MEYLTSIFVYLNIQACRSKNDLSHFSWGGGGGEVVYMKMPV